MDHWGRLASVECRWGVRLFDDPAGCWGVSVATHPRATLLHHGVPTWFKATWATGVWFSVLGSLLLLFRSRLAALAFGLSFLGLVASSVYSYGLADPTAIELMGPVAAVMSVAIVVVLIGLWLYARAMTRAGVLRWPLRAAGREALPHTPEFIAKMKGQPHIRFAVLEKFL